MQVISHSIKKIPFFILFTGLYPVLFLWAVNYFQVKTYVLPRALIISLVWSILIFLICSICTKSIKKGALIAFVILTLFYSYGHVYTLIANKSVLGFIFGRHRYLLPIYILLTICLTVIILKINKQKQDVFSFLNSLMGIMVAFSLLQVGNFFFFKTTKETPVYAQPLESTFSNDPSKPDVYYIVLDGYSRSDLLASVGFDNSKFENELRRMGFIIPRCGQSNYNNTMMSVTSTVNMDYFESMGFDLNKKIRMNELPGLIGPNFQNSLVRQKFHGYGYKFITSASTFFIDIPDSDVYLSENYSTQYVPVEQIETYKFQDMFFDTTLLNPLNEWIIQKPADFKNVPLTILMFLNPMNYDLDNEVYGEPHYMYYRSKLFSINNLERIPEIKGNKFVYIHSLISHDPFLFTPTGEFSSENEANLEGYLNQIAFQNNRLPGLLENILNKSIVPPIIIIQGDHSGRFIPDQGQTTKNFQAYYFPGVKENDLDEYFTNVNAFRFVFSKYFNEDIQLLPNKSYYDRNYHVNNELIDYNLVEPSCAN